MRIRTILAAASGGSATSGALDLACQLARRFEAHIEGLHVRPDPQALYAAAGDVIGGPDSAALVEIAVEEAEARAAHTRALFDEITARPGIPHAGLPQLALQRPSASWREEQGYVPMRVACRGRFFDFVVLGRSDRVAHEPHTDTIEQTLALSGRPIIVAPVEPPSGLGYVVALAWDGSPPAVRALVMALPFLETAGAVTLLTAGDTDPQGSRSAVDYLAWHGINAERRALPSGSGRHVGRLLLEGAQECGADLLAMGGYGHAPWHELLFGGATRTALATTPLPLLLTH
jgi:nucleotide-binding universal stress UspA family protein